MSYFAVNNVCIVNDTWLEIELQNSGGEWIQTNFDLNDVIGVDDDGTNFLIAYRRERQLVHEY